MTPSIRKARPEDLPALRQLLIRAFADDPPMNWILQGGAARDRAFDAFFEVALERLTFPFGEVYCDDELRGCALWTPPNKWRLHWWQQLRDLPSWGRAIGWSRLAFMGRATAKLTSAHPEAPHYYLLALGVDEAHRGKGLASALVKPMLARCDAEGRPAYLEASKPELVPLYAHLGFTLTQEIHLGSDGPPMFLMWRPARK